jgi:predicted regulator of Ras-like GTPase activity (Roadblock/LC7/MglB family)
MNGTPVGKHLVLSAEAVEILRQFLQNLAQDCGALAVLTVDRGGQLIVACGDTASMDTTSLAALITGTFGSTRAIASHIGEANFKRMFQQGLSRSVYMACLSTSDVLAVLFPNTITVGRVKYRLEQSLDAIDQHIQKMYQSHQSPVQRQATPAAPKLNDLF